MSKVLAKLWSWLYYCNWNLLVRGIVLQWNSVSVRQMQFDEMTSHPQHQLQLAVLEKKWFNLKWFVSPANCKRSKTIMNKTVDLSFIYTSSLTVRFCIAFWKYLSLRLNLKTLLGLLFKTPKFLPNGQDNRIGPYLSAFRRSCCMCRPQSLDGSWLIFHWLLLIHKRY